MGLSRVLTRALLGVSATEVVVETHLGAGLPAFNLVGLADVEVREARERVRAALQNAGFTFPASRLTVSLAPADLPKQSGSFDLPIALGILAASGQIPADRLDPYEWCGELSLAGEIRPVRGALPLALAARQAGRRLVLPHANLPEVQPALPGQVCGASSLSQVCAYLAGQAVLPSADDMPDTVVAPVMPDLADVRGQAMPRRALEIAAAGGHALLLCGPPGTGKSMLAERLPGLLPPLTFAEATESATVLSTVGLFHPSQWRQRFMRAPHHSTSVAALIGGGHDPRPGEISLAHHQVLFLDELPEFSRTALEALREPLETGIVSISRARRQMTFPAAFQLIAAMNPCPCGYAGHPQRECRCSLQQVARYRQRLSGPLLDRIDLRVEVGVVAEHELFSPPGESSAVVAGRVLVARERQCRRQGMLNARLPVSLLMREGALPDPVRKMLEEATRRWQLSARASHRVLRVARTVADLAGRDVLVAADLAEALQWRGQWS